MGSRLPCHVSHTAAHHWWIAASLSTPGGTDATSATVIVPRSLGRLNDGHIRRDRAELHVDPLHLLAGEVLLHSQIEPDQSERNRDRLGGCASVLRRVRVDQQLVDKCWIGMRQRVVRQLVVQFLIVRHGSGSQIRLIAILGIRTNSGYSLQATGYWLFFTHSSHTQCRRK